MTPFLPARAVRRSRLALAATLALGCTAGSVIAQDHTTGSTPLSARRIVIDSVTGRPRMPDHEDFAAARQEAAAQRAAAASARSAGTAQPLSSHPVLARMQGQTVPTRTGTLARRVGAEKLSFSVVQRGADGRLKTQCVTGEDAATHALHAHVHEEASDAQ
jgi:hypothetical protein